MQCSGIGVGASPITLEGLVAPHVGDDLALLARHCPRVGAVGPEFDDPDPLVQPRLPGEPSFAAARGSVVKV
jgi:hypothetical protein